MYPVVSIKMAKLNATGIHSLAALSLSPTHDTRIPSAQSVPIFVTSEVSDLSGCSTSALSGGNAKAVVHLRLLV